MTTLTAPELMRLAAGIRLLVLDIDGVLTDGTLHYDAEGREFKSFHVRDGYGMRQAMKSGIEVAVISGRRSGASEGRMRDLGVTHALLNREDKSPALDELLARTGIPAAATACVGDDAPDLPVMQRVALPIAVADCHPVILPAAAWRTSRPGGRGAVREVCDLLLAARAGAGR